MTDSTKAGHAESSRIIERFIESEAAAGRTTGRVTDEQAEQFDRHNALRQAKRNESETGMRWFALLRHDGVWVLTDSMPLLGEWYDSDGHRHG